MSLNARYLGMLHKLPKEINCLGCFGGDIAQQLTVYEDLRCVALVFVAVLIPPFLYRYPLFLCFFFGGGEER